MRRRSLEDKTTDSKKIYHINQVREDEEEKEHCCRKYKAKVKKTSCCHKVGCAVALACTTVGLYNGYQYSNASSKGRKELAAASTEQFLYTEGACTTGNGVASENCKCFIIDDAERASRIKTSVCWFRQESYDCKEYARGKHNNCVRAIDTYKFNKEEVEQEKKHKERLQKQKDDEAAAEARRESARKEQEEAYALRGQDEIAAEAKRELARKKAQDLSDKTRKPGLHEREVAQSVTHCKLEQVEECACEPGENTHTRTWNGAPLVCVLFQNENICTCNIDTTDAKIAKGCKRMSPAMIKKLTPKKKPCVIL